jgi:hypothetical protein
MNINRSAIARDLLDNAPGAIVALAPDGNVLAGFERATSGCDLIWKNL